MPLPLLVTAGIAAWRGAAIGSTLAPLVKPGIGIVKRFLKTTARPGLGSKVTKGPLRVGKQVIYGSARPGTGTVLRAGAGVVTVGGISLAVAHRMTPRTQSQPQAFRPAPKPSTKKETRKCCPTGTKRMVCFKRGRVKARKKAKAKKGKPRTFKTKKRSTRKRRK